MLKSELLELVAGGEDSYTEFKRDVSQRSDLAGKLVAFANTDGGQLLIGILENDRKIFSTMREFRLCAGRG